MRKIFYILILLFLVPANNSMAQPSRGIILLNNFQHGVNFSYQYDGQTSNSPNNETTFSNHELSEAYHFNVDYGLYSPRLLKGNLFAELKYDQEVFDGTNEPSGGRTGLSLRYLVNGTLLDRHPYPVTFFAGSNVSSVPRAFASNLDVKTDSYGAGLILKNNFLPLQFNYSINKSTTTGLANERDQSLESITCLANHRIKGLSETRVELIFSSYNTDTKGGADIKESFLSNEARISNTLAWNRPASAGNLFTSYRYLQEAGDRQGNTSDFSESLVWYLGKALETGVKYSNIMQQALSQTQTENSGDLWLKHQLFQSLRTNLLLHASTDKYTTGSENEISGTLSLDYQKKLPAESQLQLGASRTYGVVDRNLTGNSIPIKGERIIASFLGQITLKNLDIIPGTIVVHNADPAKRILPYVQGAANDYTVEQLGRITLITINPAGEIPNGDTLLVDYEISVNPSVNYAKNAMSLSSGLLLFSGRYRIYANLDTYDQQYLSGRVDASNFIQSNSFRTGLEFAGEMMSFRGEYINYRSTYSAFQSYDASFRYARDFTGSTLSLYLNDRLTFREDPPAITSVIVLPGTANSANTGSNSGYDNSISAGAAYRRSLLKSATMNLTANYIKVMGQLPKDAYSLGAGLQARFGKVVAEIRGDVHWLTAENSSRRDDKIRIDLTRYF